MNEPFAFYEKTAEYVKQRAPFVPEIALILGTGLGPLAGQIENPVTLDYREIPNFLVSTAPDHAGKLIFGTLEGKKLVCMSGRFHSYEGYDFEQLSIPVRLFKLLGVKQVIVTNAAGGVNEGYRPGDIMVISDHIKLNAIRLLGGDAVGMSTVTEALTAAHCGLELLGFSVITNMAAGMLDQPLTTEEVSETGRMIEQQFSAYLKSIIREMH